VQRALVAILAAALLLFEVAPARAQDAPPRRPPRASEQSTVPVSWIVVGAGVLMVFAAIPLVVQADQRVRREDGVTLGKKNANCGAAPGVCSVLDSADTNATPFWIAAGVSAGLGVATITTGAILHWKVPSTRGEQVIGVEPRPGGGTATLRMQF
jgi:hypothetical protein